MPVARNFRPCRHLFTDGHQCGSPALRGEELCFYHHATRRPIKQQVLHGRTCATLPEPLDLHAIQRGLAELLRLTAAEAIELNIAAQLHRQLATASQNLARIERAEARALALNPDRRPITDYTNHPTLGTIAPEPAPEPETPQASGRQPQPDHTRSPEVQKAQTSVQTQLQPNEDFETSLKTSQTPVEPTAPAILPASLPDPLPDPIARFTLPPAPEYVRAQAEMAASESAFAEALQKMAEGIRARAETRARNHAELYPLIDDTAADQELVYYQPELHAVLRKLNQEAAIAPETCGEKAAA